MTDHLGTPRVLVDADGSIAWRARYRCFGSAATVGIGQPLRFPGHYYDKETGLHYNRARYYSPTWGRYLSRDPLDVAGGLNLYLYAGNDPINSSDALGLIGFWQGVLAGAAVVAGAALLVVAAPVVVAAVAAVAAGSAIAAGTTLAVAGVAVGAGLIGAGIGLALAPEGCVRCQAIAAARGFGIGAGAALAVMGMAFTAAGMAAGLGGGGALLAAGARGGGTILMGGAINWAGVQAGSIAVAGVAMMAGSGSGGGNWDDDEDDGDRQRGEKGKSFRGGRKSQRDNWYGRNDKDFQRWWHREGKEQFGGKDIENDEEAERAWQEWINQGRPTVK